MQSERGDADMHASVVLGLIWEWQNIVSGYISSSAGAALG